MVLSFNMIEVLVGLYFGKVPLSNLSRKEAEKQISRLLEKHTFEELYFFISYASVEYPFASIDHIERMFNDLWEVIVKPRYEIAKLSRESRKREEELAEYDSRNIVERANTPKWFRESFNKHLFE